MTSTKNLKVSAVICAAGKGLRAGFSRNKLLAPLGGTPALLYTLNKFRIAEIDEVIVASSKNDIKEIETLARPLGFKVVQGGRTRSESVKRALEAVTGDIVLIHDGARPYVSKELILSCIESVKKYSSGVCALPVTDTVVMAKQDSITGRTDRNELYTLQTPQGFFTEDIRRAYALAGDNSYTDDSAVYGEFIGAPRLIDGDPENIKLTYKSDFTRSIPQLTLYSEGNFRIGLGMDVHPFGSGGHVVLGGVKIPCDGKLIAHSDGDVVIHAVMDALLSAAGLKDIGHYFPDSDPAYKDADSGELLKKVNGLIREEGFEPVNLSVTIQAERPRLSPHIDNIRARLGELTDLPPENIAVSAGTHEGLGFVGKGLGIAAYCNALIRKI